VSDWSRLNPHIRYVAHREHSTPHTALATMKDYDLILDCTDHPSSRYLISDSAVLSGKILISGSALRTEGQLMVLNNPPNGSQDRPRGPCYRCVFPRPPPADTVISCGDGGILGPVVGVIGVLMALKAIQLLTAGAKRGYENETQPLDDQPTMLLFSAYTNPPFRQIRLCGKRKNCVACSSSPKISADSLTSGSLDYKVLCGMKTPVQTLNPDERIEAKELHKILNGDQKSRILLDVRDRTQFSICNLPGTINIPFSDIQAMSKVTTKEKSKSLALLEEIDPDTPIYTVCRFGNDSQLAVRKLKELGLDNGGERWIGDVRGGYRAWKRQVDPHWPEY
jgi:adenylyltransferase/sulfurtransferase